MEMTKSITGTAPVPAPMLTQQPVLAQQPLAPRPPGCSQQTPPFFQSMNKRRGKWTAEEEEYALFVIKEFERGMLRECENGTTLRAYLSRKLHCAPMRISKKYAGKSIGKLVFQQKTNIEEEKLVASDAKLRDLEVKFYKSLYEEIHPSQHLAANFQHYFPSPASMPAAPLAAGTFLPQPTIMAQTAITHPAVRQHLQSAHQPVIMPQGAAQHAVSPVSHIFSPQPVVMPSNMHQVTGSSAVPTVSSVHAKNLQQTYLNALNQMMKTNGQSLVPPLAAIASNNNGTVAPSRATPQAPSAPPTAVMATSRPKGVQMASTAAAPSLQHKPHPTTAPPGVKSAPSTEVPDFLSGFEKVNGEDQRWMIPGAPLLAAFEGGNGGVPLQCSPPLTSKSFDDLHQLLGSGLAPNNFDLNASSKSAPAQQQPAPVAAATNNIMTTNHSDTPTNISADIYAAFAQQSAAAVSQHSAYCRGGNETSTEGNGVSTVAPAPAAPDISSSLAAICGAQQTSVVSHANLRAHATQQQKLEGQNVGVASLKPKPASQTTYPSTTARLVSGSELSSEVGSTEDSSSMHGSTSSSNNGTSDTTSNDSDSVSDEGPPRKKTRTGEGNARNSREEVVSPVSSDRSSP